MFALSFLFLTAVSMVNAVPLSDNTVSFSLLDIISQESAPTLEAMIDSSPDHSYVKLDLSDVSLLKVSILDGTDDSVISHMEMATNADATVYKKAMYGEADGQSQADATDSVSLSKRASGCGQYCAQRS